MSPSKIIFSHIAAVSQNNVIGLKGALPWHIPEDLKYFYKMTKNKALIMGRKTFESLGQPLPNRLHVIITKQKDFQPKIEGFNYIPLWTGGIAARPDPKNLMAAVKKALSVVMSGSVKNAMDFCSRKEVLDKYGREIFIIGGGEIYKQTLPLADRLYITRIHKNYEGDAFYPKIPMDQFKEARRTDMAQPAPFSFLVYERL